MWSDDFDVRFCNPFDKKEKNSYYIKLEHLGRYIYARDRMKYNGYKSVLDIDCGSGYGSVIMAQDGAEVDGVNYDKNIHKKALACAKESNLNNVHIYFGDEFEQICKNKKYDMIVCFETLALVKNPQDMLAKIKSMLKPNGMLIVSVPNKKFEPISPDGKIFANGHINVYTPTKIKNMLEKVGFCKFVQLGQPYSNTFLNEEYFIINKYEMSELEVKKFYNQNPEALVYFARLMAYPVKKNLEDSYSIIYVCGDSLSFAPNILK